MTKLIHLPGEYNRTGSTLQAGNVKLLITKYRNRSNSNSPNQSILLIHPDGKREYVSGLFQNKDGTYRFDYLGRNYRLKLDDYSAQISKRGNYQKFTN